MIFDLWARWLGFTARPIDSRPLRLLKSFVALAIIGDLVAMMVRGASDAILYPQHLGGIAAKPANWLLLDWGAHTGPLLLGLVLVALVFVVADVLTRPALVVGLIAYAQFGHMYIPGDRGIDRVLRTTLLILVFSAVVDGRVAKTVAAWPADLIRWLLVMVYLDAGFSKCRRAAAWLEIQEFPELYTIMAAPNIGRIDPVFWADYPWVFTGGGWFTFALELSSPLILTRYAPYWAIGGVLMHVGIAVSMELGMFPFGMLALYPILFSPWTEKACDRWEAYLGKASQ